MRLRFEKEKLPEFVADQRGGSAVEFALLAVVFIGMMLGTIDLCRYVWELNLAKAAARSGARLAVVKPMVPTFLQSYDAVDAGAVLGNGLSVPVDVLPVFTCSWDAADELKRICSPSSGDASSAMDTVTFQQIVSSMKKYYGAIRENNVVIQYQHVGLGVSGNPCAPDVEPMITVSLVGLTFTPLSLRLFGRISLPMPEMRSTYSGESLGMTGCSSGAGGT